MQAWSLARRGSRATRSPHSSDVTLLQYQQSENGFCPRIGHNSVEVFWEVKLLKIMCAWGGSYDECICCINGKSILVYTVLANIRTVTPRSGVRSMPNHQIWYWSIATPSSVWLKALSWVETRVQSFLDYWKVSNVCGKGYKSGNIGNLSGFG